jgi:hypothetical protein
MATEAQPELGEDIREESSESVEVYVPVPGPVEGLLGVGLFYLLLDRLTPSILTALEDPLPDLVPEPVTTGLAGLIWLVFATTVLGSTLDFLRENPRTFPSERRRTEWLERVRPSRREYRNWVALLVVGGVTAVLTWSMAIDVLADLLVVVVDLPGTVPPGITLWSTVGMVLFFVSFAATAWALDRLIVGGLRDLLYRRSR